MWNSLKGKKRNENTYSIHICFKREIWNASKKVFLRFYSTFWSNTFPSDLGYKSESHGSPPPTTSSFQKKWGEHLFINLKKSNTSPALGHVAHSTQSAFIWLERERGQEQRKKWRLNMLASVPYGPSFSISLLSAPLFLPSLPSIPHLR